MLKRKYYGDLAVNAVFAVFAVVCLASKTASDEFIAKDEYMAPGFYSDVLCAALILLIGTNVLFTLFRHRKEAEQQKGDTETLATKTHAVAFMMVCSVLYVLGIMSIGFYIVTAACLFVMNMTFENWEKKYLLKAVIFSLGTCAVFFIVFKYLKIFLPKAILF